MEDMICRNKYNSGFEMGDIPDYFIPVSLRLSDYMQEICPREETRQQRSKHWAFFEALRSITESYTRKCSAVLYGSQAEGSTTPGMESDIDFVFVCNRFIVTKTAQEWDPRCKRCSVLTTGAPPGYVQLRCIERDQFYMMHITNNARQLPLISHKEVREMIDKEDNTKRVIEQLKSSYGRKVDISFALQVKFSELDLHHLLSRQRTNPKLQQVLESSEAKDDYVNLEFGDSPFSSYECFKWRICFSITERRLVDAFNSVQMSSYILLKMVVKSLVHPYMENVLSSYLLKCLMFQMIDSTKETLWLPENLLFCTEMCLTMLSYYVMEGNFPDYFIPTNNLFQERVCGPVRFRLSALLSQLLAEKGRFLLRIQCDQIGDVLALQSVDQGIIGKDFNSFGSEYFAIRTCLYLIQTLVVTPYCDHPFKLRKRYEYDHGSTLLRQALSVLIGDICSRLDTADDKEPRQQVRLETLKKCFHIPLMNGHKLGNISCSLKIAAINYMSEKPMDGFLLLQSVQETLNLALSTASVHCHYIVSETVELLSKGVSIRNILMKLIAHSVVYTENEVRYTPKPLVLEMHRSFVSDGIGEQFWYGWAVVDAKVYALFLLHQCYSALRMDSCRLQTLLKLMRIFDQDVTLLHRDTAFNLLAFCLRQEGITLASYRCLRHSLFLNGKSDRAASRRNNAAIWQLAFVYNQKGRRKKNISLN